MALQKPLHIKPLVNTITSKKFYLFEIKTENGALMYSLYDEDMGEPIAWGSLGSIQKIVNQLIQEVSENPPKREKYVVWFLKKEDMRMGWKQWKCPISTQPVKVAVVAAF